MAKDGYRVAAIDYRGYGMSPGSPSVGGLVDDAERALEELLLREPAEQIIVHGHSLGGAVATRLASRHQDLRALVLESTFTSVDRVAADMVAPAFPFGMLIRDNADSLSTIKSYAYLLLL